MKPILLGCCLGLASCQTHDWRSAQIEQAEAQMRVEVGDSSAQFLDVQVTGDEQTGQICGRVKTGPDASPSPVRFIVYIDGTAGPFVAAGKGRQRFSQDFIDRAWRADCLGEGYQLPGAAPSANGS